MAAEATQRHTGDHLRRTTAFMKPNQHTLAKRTRHHCWHTREARLPVFRWVSNCRGLHRRFQSCRHDRFVCPTVPMLQRLNDALLLHGLNLQGCPLVRYRSMVQAAHIFDNEEHDMRLPDQFGRAMSGQAHDVSVCFQSRLLSSTDNRSHTA